MGPLQSNRVVIDGPSQQEFRQGERSHHSARDHLCRRERGGSRCSGILCSDSYCVRSCRGIGARNASCEWRAGHQPTKMGALRLSKLDPIKSRRPLAKPPSSKRADIQKLRQGPSVVLTPGPLDRPQFALRPSLILLGAIKEKRSRRNLRRRDGYARANWRQ
jgi:hypothetical protein